MAFSSGSEIHSEPLWLITVMLWFVFKYLILRALNMSTQQEVKSQFVQPAAISCSIHQPASYPDPVSQQPDRGVQPNENNLKLSSTLSAVNGIPFACGWKDLVFLLVGSGVYFYNKVKHSEYIIDLIRCTERDTVWEVPFKMCFCFSQLVTFYLGVPRGSKTLPYLLYYCVLRNSSCTYLVLLRLY